MGASLKDIAALAGVSVSTVSRVLNEKSYVNEETREKVLRIMEREHFQPNAIAQSLKNGISNTLCLIIPNIQNLIFAPIARGVEDIARKNGYNVILCDTYENENTERECIEMMRMRWVDGFIVASAVGDKKSIYNLWEDKIPVILVNRFDEKDINRLPIVSIDNYTASYEATSYLIRSGYRRIAVAMGANIHYFYRERLRGYRQALSDHGIKYDEKLILQEMHSSKDFHQLTKQIMASEIKPDVFFATSDPKAIVIMHALHEMNYNIPGDIGVLGFDNVELSSVIEPELSTVSQPFYDLGAVAAQDIIDQIRLKNEKNRLPEPTHHILKHELILRHSLKAGNNPV